jgi:hypothetical protein
MATLHETQQENLELEDKIARLERELGKALKLLEGLEWAGQQASTVVCPECWEPYDTREHEVGCALAAAIKPPEIADKAEDRR